MLCMIISKVFLIMKAPHINANSDHLVKCTMNISPKITFKYLHECMNKCARANVSMNGYNRGGSIRVPFTRNHQCLPNSPWLHQRDPGIGQVFYLVLTRVAVPSLFMCSSGDDAIDFDTLCYTNTRPYGICTILYT